MIYKRCRCADRDRCPHPFWGEHLGRRMCLARCVAGGASQRKEAEHAFERFKAWVERGCRGRRPRRLRNPFLFDVVDRFRRSAKGLSRPELEALDAIRTGLGMNHLIDIGTRDVERWVNDHRRAGEPQQIVRGYVLQLKTVLDWCVTRRMVDRYDVSFRLLEGNPARQEPPLASVNVTAAIMALERRQER